MRTIEYCCAKWFLCTLLSGFSLPLLAEYSICNTNQLSSCITNLNDFQCLETLQACGRYDEIIIHFESEFTQDLDSFYFKGVSYYQLAQLDNSKANACEYYNKAFNNLAAYENLYFESGEESFEHTADYVHHVTKLMQELLDSGCINTEISLPIIRKKTREYAKEMLDSIFIDNRASAGMAKIVAAIKKKINELNEAIITTASDIETQIGLRSVAIMENIKTMASLNKAIDKLREKIGDEALETVIDNGSGLAVFNQKFPDVERIMGEQDPEQYAAKRDDVIASAIAAVDRASDSSALVSNQLKTESPAIQRVQEALENGDGQPASKPVQVFEDIKRKYHQSREHQCVNNNTLWFCS